MVVGTLNLGSETGLQFKVPTTMRRHGVTGSQTGSETGWQDRERDRVQFKVPTTMRWHASRGDETGSKTKSEIGGPLMLVGTLNCSILVGTKCHQNAAM